jgi:hypothetical protein
VPRAALGRRLGRRGVWPAALSAALLSDCHAPAAPPPGLVVATVEAMAGPAGTAATVSAAVAALAEGVLLPMPLTTAKAALVLILAVGSIVTAAGLSASRATPLLPPAREKGAAAARGEGDPDRAAATLAGRWVMTLPAGFEHQIVVRPLGGNRLAVEKAVRFSGIYELRDGRLVLVKPTNPAESGFEWEVRTPSEVVLVAQPPVAKTGQNYLGATLTRPAGAR